MKKIFRFLNGYCIVIKIMIISDSEPPVPYEPLSYDDEITEEFEIPEDFETNIITNNHNKFIIEDCRNECYNCGLIYQPIYLYENVVDLCLACCRLYDYKYMCNGCNTIYMTDIWHKNKIGQLCEFCYHNDLRYRETGHICSSCNLFKQQITWHSNWDSGKNKPMCNKCYISRTIRNICSRCCKMKSIKNWYNTKNGIICGACKYNHY